MPIKEFESDDGVVIDENDGQGPKNYTIYHRTNDKNRPYAIADRVEIEGNGAFVYGKLVLFGKVAVETYPHKGQTFATVTPLEIEE